MSSGRFPNLKPVSLSEKEEVLLDAINKTIENVAMEYDMSYAQICGCLGFIKGEFEIKYWHERFGDK